MLKSGILSVGMSLSAVLMTAMPALAADDSSSQSAAELQNILQNQKTRGLVIAPSTGNTSTQATDTTTQTAVTTAAPEATEYTQLDEADTIAIQIKFDFDSAALRNDQKSKLTNLCTAMKAVEGSFRIIGHTDASGSADYNERLSLLRAQEVKRHMVSECGIAGTKLDAIGVGEEFPSNTANPRADENRRVEFQALS